jgi:hypothetical protein
LCAKGATSSPTFAVVRLALSLANARSTWSALNSIEDDALGEELQVIWEIEPGARAFEKMELPEPKGFDQPAHLEAFLDAVRWGAASIADTRQLQSPFRSGIEIESYQLDPVVRADGQRQPGTFSVIWSL